MVGLSLVLGTLGPMLARELLQAIRVPADVLDDAIVYLRIILAGTIFTGVLQHGQLPGQVPR